MQVFEPLLHVCYYHIYNRGINSENLFAKTENYLHFLKFYDKYIEPIAETFAWCLMPNHFHLLVMIKEEKDIRPLIKPLSGQKAADRVFKAETLSVVENPASGLLNEDKKPVPERQFSHLFNSYAQAYNKTINRHGGLFETPFKRIKITNELYFTRLIQYIHQNPVHHGFCERAADYSWSSYGSIISEKATKLMRQKVLNWFGDKENFITCHNKSENLGGIENLLLE